MDSTTQEERYVIYKPFAENIVTIEAIYSGYIPSDIPGGVLLTTPDPVKNEYPNLRPVMRMKLDTLELFYDYESDFTLEMRLSSVATDVGNLENASNLLTSNVEGIGTELTDTQVGLTETYETALVIENDNTQTQIAVTEVYEGLLGTQANITTTQLALENLLNRVQNLEEEIALLKGE